MPNKETFWDFACRTYERETIAPLCLQLQNDHGLDVNVLLFILWSGDQGQGVSDLGFWQDVVQYSREWQEGVVKPLRSARQQLKIKMQLGEPHLEELRKAILLVELQAEQEQIEQLEKMHRSCPQDKEATSEQMVRLYLSALPAEPNDVQDQLLVKLLAASV